MICQTSLMTGHDDLNYFVLRSYNCSCKVLCITIIYFITFCNLVMGQTTPAGLSIYDFGHNEVTLTWQNPDELEHNIYYSESSNVRKELHTIITGIIEVPYTISNLSKGTMYYFVVISLDDDGDESEESTVNIITKPGIQAIAKDGSIEIIWNPVPDATAYELYWSTVYGITTSSSRIIDIVNDNNQIYLHTGLTNGVIYHYKVRSIDEAKMEIDFTEEVEARPTQPIVDTLIQDFGGEHAFGLQYWGTIWEDRKSQKYLSYSKFEAQQKDNTNENKAYLTIFPSTFATRVTGFTLYYQYTTVAIVLEDAIVPINRFADIKGTPNDISDDVFVHKFQRRNRTISIGTNAVPFVNIGTAYSSGTLNISETLSNGTDRINRIPFGYFNLFATTYLAIPIWKMDNLFFTITHTAILPIPVEGLNGNFATQTFSFGVGITYYDETYCKSSNKCKFGFPTVIGISPEGN